MVLLGKSSAECLRRFRSLSPVFKSSEEPITIREQCETKTARYRSHSYPSRKLFKKDIFGNKRSLSTERERETVAEYHERDRYGIEQSIKHIKSQVANVHRGRQVLKTNRQKLHNNVDKAQFTAYIAEYPTIARKVKAKTKELNNLNKEPVVQKNKFGEYHLKDSKPVFKENVFDVFGYYSEQHKWKDTKVLPHLQPYNLKPYGTGENLLFPIYNVNRKRQIVYPEYTEMSNSYKRNNESSNKLQNLPAASSSQHREFCTSPRETKCKPLIPENETKLIPKKDEKSENILQKSQTQQTSQAVPTLSEDLEKCNQIISEYKKLNPSYTHNKKEYKSGSMEEKEAVNNAVNFAANFKKYFLNNNKVENSDKILSIKNKTISDVQVREHHEGGVETKGLPPPPPEEKAPNDSLLQHSSSQPIMEKKKYSFSGATLHFPEVPVTPVRVRVGPKANLLQSSAPPEAAKCWDDIRLDKDERLVSPWPSYADQLKGLLTQKDANQIKYPPQNNNTKTVKNTTNLQIQQSTNNQPILELNSRSLHKNINTMESDHAAILKTKEPFQKRLFHYCKNQFKSLPDLRSFSTTRKGNGNEETVAQKRFKFNKEGNPICDSTESDAPPKTTEYFDKQDCFCIEPKLPTYAPPLKRLKKIIVEEPPKICPVEEECEPVMRADHGLTVQFKKLPQLIPRNCKPPYKELQEGYPLPRLKKKRIEEPLKICPNIDEEIYCPPRADAALQIQKKCLPKLVPRECPSPEIKIADCPPLQPLKKVKIPEPVKICPQVEPETCPPRADENLMVTKKRLPKLIPSECPRLSQKPLENIPLRRLIKRVTPYTPRDTLEEHPTEEECSPRADAGLKIKQKKLRPLITSDKCQPPKIQLKPGYPLKRLEKIKVNEPPRICPTAEEEMYKCPPRADDGLKVKTKHLPVFEPMPCPHIEHRGFADVAPLKPLKKVKIKEPEKFQPEYIPEPCPPRADEGMVFQQKPLPQLKASDCPYIPNLPPKNACPLKPLKKVNIPEPVRRIPECPPEEPCPPRADEGMIMREKRLPQLQASDCPCIEEKVPDDVPLKRLKKVRVEEPPRICIEDDPCNDPSRARSDDLCGYTVKSKELPPMLLKPENNHVSTRTYAKKTKRKEKAPRVNVSHKRKFSLYSKMQGSWKSRRILSAITFNIKIVKDYSKINDPYDEKYTHENPGCCCVEEQYPQTDITPKLKRLPKFKKEDKDWSKFKKCLPKCRNPRADDNLKPKKKRLPRLKPSNCPCKEIKSFKNGIYPKLKRLPKFKKEDIDWAKMKECLLPCRNPRADDNWKSKKKSLRKLKPRHCPCKEQYSTLVDVAPLKRLPKFEKPDIDWETKKKCLPPCRNIRADESLKMRKKCLPRLKINKCPCVEDNYVPTRKPKLKRLRKFKKPDIDWDAQLQCQKPCRNPRADDNWKSKKKSLPKINGNLCPCINLNNAKFDVPPLKRLPKFPKPDINWKDFLICISPCRTPRADDNLKPKSKSLPLLRSSKCPCLEVDDPPCYLPTIKRLPKFKKEDKDWLQFEICQKPCRNPRADDSWKLKKKPLPKLEPSDCPCLKIDTPKYDVEPLKRLPKFKKEDINWKIILKCIKPCSLTERADDNLKTKQKRLPLLKVSKCPCIEHPEIPSYDPPMKRLSKFKKPDIDWAALLACQKPCRNPRSDDNWKMPKKRLPKIKNSDCPCINLANKIVDVKPLKRLPKFKKEDKDWASFDICRIPCRTPRADENLKMKEKRLRPLRPSKCPCIEHSEIPQYQPCLKRLPKFKKADVDWETLLACQKPCGRMPRADDNWRMRKKTLPRIRISKCPCEEPPEMVDVEPLKRLPKFKKEDKDWKSFEVCKPPCRNSRADDNLKVKSKSLPRLRPSKCPCIEEKVPCEYSPELKRLTKFKEQEEEGDIIWKNVPKCMPPCRNERADDLLGYKVKKKKLPPLIQRKCYHTTQCHLSYPVRRQFMTSPLKHQKKKDERERAKMRLAQSGVKSEKECQKIRLVTKKVCPEMSLKGCPPPDKSAQEGCFRDYKFVKCTKQNSPYPSFSECGTLYETPSCECLVDYKILQPKYPIIEKLKLLKPPPPEHAHIDGRKERDCLFKKMGKQYQGITKTCQNFNCPDNEMTGMGRLRKEQEEKSSALVCSSQAAKGCAEKKDKGLWERICDYFKPKQNCPKPGEWKQKKLIDDAEKAAKAAGMVLCKPKDCKPKVADPCSHLYAKSGKSKKTNPCKNPFPKGKKKSHKRNKCKDPFPRESASYDPCKPKKSSRKAWERNIAKEDEADDGCRVKKETSSKTCKSKRRVKCKPTKFKKIKSKPSSSCKSKNKKKKKLECSKTPKASDKKCEYRKDRECEEEVDYSTMLPPEIPVCSPRHKRVQVRPKKEIKQQYTPMDDCFRKIKDSKEMHLDCTVRNIETESCGRQPQPSPFQSGVCKRYTLKTCSPRARQHCEKDYTSKCKSKISPYPSFSECRPPFPKLKESESLVAKNRAKTALTKLKLNLSQGSRMRGFAEKTANRCNGTISRVKRAFSFHPPVEWRRTYCSDAKYSKLLNSINRKNAYEEKRKDTLNRRLLDGIEEGIERLESQDLDVPNNPYYQILKALQKLSEKEMFDFFDQESQFNPFEPLKSDTRDTVSYVCQMNPKENNPYLLGSDICFEPKCVGISDVNAQLEELQIVEAFRKFCTKICEESEAMEIPYEEKERMKTEDMKRELDQLLKRTRSE